MRLGGWEADIVSGADFRLDGGAMFGTVPKVVWDKHCPADEDNQILLATHCLLLRGHGRTVLVDAGLGDKEPEGFRARFKCHGRGVLEASLAAKGVAPADVDLVILTHLHFDHAGGGTCLDASGRAVPAFPRARYLVQRRDLDNARAGFLRERASYLPANWEPLLEAGVLDLADGAQPLLSGLAVRPIPGHTPGLQGVVVEGDGARLLYLADLIPTASHIQPAWVMGYDLDVVTCVEERQRVLEEVADTGAVLVFEHDPRVPAGTVHRAAKGRYEVVPAAL